jgi:hypothetical protein
MKSFEEANEKSAHVHSIGKLIRGTKNELQRLAIQAQSDDRLYHNIYTMIKDTPFKYLSPDKNVLEYSLFQIMEFIIKGKVGAFYFIENKENNIIAFISYYENKSDPSVIELVRVANFYMKNEDDLLSDTLELMNRFLKNYREVNFSASIYNEKAIMSYDLFFKRHKGDPKNRVQDGNEINWKLLQESCY